ncbi:RNA recognition motif domain containingprotein [Babesia bovis T2Bo]|uniref:RNA recognition motif domain containingprotein n=1 Tax=Babesia bovis T2Bo TaxID=484906 RepID=UPI001C35C8E9|nr:RNA recognition motif domain containingprotein [Babesia bovis T2Bo]EDO05229.2 RNA recognition motif domain containingprotein [Babesia bovis T2Bo]
MNDKAKNIKLFVGNLPYEITEIELRNILQGCGNIRFAIIRKDRQTNKSKGYAHVEYRYDWEAVAAFKRLLGKEIHGRILKVDFCDEVLRKRYSELVTAAANIQKPVTVSSVLPSVLSSEGNGSINTHADQNVAELIDGNRISFNSPEYLSTLLQNASQKRLRPDDIMVDSNGRMFNEELFSIISNMNMLHVAELINFIDERMMESTVNSRHVIRSHSNFDSVLTHAKLLLNVNMINSGMSTNMRFSRNDNLSSILKYYILGLKMNM